MPCKCGEALIFNQKRNLCKKCYGRFYRGWHPFHLKSKNQDNFKKHLIKKYGIEMIYDLSKLKMDFNVTLQQVGDRYNVTREYVRQIYYKYFNEPYTQAKHRLSKNHKTFKEINRKKNLLPLNKLIKCKLNGTQYKGAISELAVFDKCRDLGYSCSLYKNRKIDFIINGYRVDVKSLVAAHKTSSHSLSSYYHFHATDYQRKNCDFIIAHIPKNNIYYIIPSNIIKERGKHIYLRKEDHHQHRWNNAFPQIRPYEEYRDAWCLLNPVITAQAV